MIAWAPWSDPLRSLEEHAPPNLTPHQFELPVQRLPVIGQSFAHSAFEVVQQAAITAAGLPIGIERWEKRPHLLPDVIAQLRRDEFAGALVEAPHKEKVSPLVDSLSGDARLTGAVNVIVRDGDRLIGHNTDVDGVRAGLGALTDEPEPAWPRDAMVLGAGGGARAVVAVLIGAGAERIAVFNRHLHRAEALVAHFARHARQADIRARPWHETFMEAELGHVRLLVNTSGIGVEAGASPIPAPLLSDGLLVLDLVLNHEATPLMRHARDRGGRVANGQVSFLASSAATFKLVTGHDAPAEVMRQALAGELGLAVEHVAVVGD
jgi:shikimate dehydrogenase